MRVCIFVLRREIVRAERTYNVAASAGVDKAVEEELDVVLMSARGGEALYSSVRVSVGSKLPIRSQSSVQLLQESVCCLQESILGAAGAVCR